MNRTVANNSSPPGLSKIPTLKDSVTRENVQELINV